MDKTTTISYTSSFISVVFGLTFNEFVAFLGFLVGVATFITNLWFKWQHLKIAKETKILDKD
jgi:hypothetical protein